MTEYSDQVNWSKEAKLYNRKYNKGTKGNKLNGHSEQVNRICAVCIISESEIAKVIPDYSKEFSERAEFIDFLYGLGIDTSKNIIRQDALQHRNRFGEIVICSRWVGNERTDKEWIKSGYASKEAIDKATGGRILEDIYRTKNLTEDAQIYLEKKDARNQAFESIFLAVKEEYERVENEREAKRYEEKEQQEQQGQQKGNNNDE